VTLPSTLPKSTLYRAEGIVLRHRPLGEADRLVILYTREHGKLRASGRGVKKTTSRLAGHIEPLTHVSLLLVKGANLDSITQAQTLHRFIPLREDLRRMARAMYAAELVDLFTEEQAPQAELFTLLLETLHLLATSADPARILHRFEMQFLRLMGYEPQLSACSTCGRAPSATPVFSAVWGGLLCPACAPRDQTARLLAPPDVAALSVLMRGRIEEVQRLDLPEERRKTLAGLLRWYVQHIIERPVKSGAFLDALG
jgi:DNA repair protein RecO (recombination protein O)